MVPELGHALESQQGLGIYPREVIRDIYREVVGDNYPCEILTLGIDSSWRIIPPATLDLKTQSICIDGVLYWGRDSHPKYTVVSLDLMKEKFRSKPIPHYMTETNK
ncbi:putative F-box protein [Forsythia ovata]|uniref:F-box protein n=1 Tax=Forsythia ovata TaxID=205694 RepID=A0ABD1S8K5_9LAMI